MPPMPSRSRVRLLSLSLFILPTRVPPPCSETPSVQESGICEKKGVGGEVRYLPESAGWCVCLHPHAGAASTDTRAFNCGTSFHLSISRKKSTLALLLSPTPFPVRYPQALNPQPQILHPTPYTLHPAPRTPTPEPCTRKQGARSQ